MREEVEREGEGKRGRERRWGGKEKKRRVRESKC